MSESKTWKCPQCGTECPDYAGVCSCGYQRPGFTATPAGGSPPVQSRPDDFTSRMIPTANPPALLSYYLGLFSIGCGLILAPIAFVYASKGLKRIKEDPSLPGKTHAYVGIGCGAAGLLVWLVPIIIGLVAYLAAPAQSR